MVRFCLRFCSFGVQYHNFPCVFFFFFQHERHWNSEISGNIAPCDIFVFELYSIADLAPAICTKPMWIDNVFKGIYMNLLYIMECTNSCILLSYLIYVNLLRVLKHKLLMTEILYIRNIFIHVGWYQCCCNFDIRSWQLFLAKDSAANARIFRSYKKKWKLTS